MYNKPELVLIDAVGSVVEGSGPPQDDSPFALTPPEGFVCGLDD